MTITWFQYSATSGRPRLPLKYTRLRISFWKQLPPKPTLARKKWGPMRRSTPAACATSSTLAPVASQIAAMALIEEMRWASSAFAASFVSSLLQRPVRMTRSSGTQCWYTSLSSSAARLPCGVLRLPISTRSGLSRSCSAVPSERNSGFDRIWKATPGLLFDSRIARMDAAVRHGTVDFSTMILGDLATDAMRRVDASTYRKSAAKPLPIPDVLVGVFTLTNTICASSIARSMSVVKKRLRPRHSPTTSARPGSKTGSWDKSCEFHAAIRWGFTSTIVTVMSGHCCASTEHVGPPTYPAPIQQILVIFSGTSEESTSSETTMAAETREEPRTCPSPTATPAARHACPNARGTHVSSRHVRIHPNGQRAHGGGVPRVGRWRDWTRPGRESMHGRTQSRWMAQNGSWSRRVMSSSSWISARPSTPPRQR